MKNLISFILLLTPILFTIVYFINYQSNIPFADDWSAINGFLIRFIYGNDNLINKLQLLVSQCNEHREGFLAIISLLQFAILGEINFTVLNFVGISTSLGMFIVFYQFIRDQGKSLVFAVPIVYILFNAYYFHNFYWPTCALQHNPIVLFVLLAFYLLYKKKTIVLAIGMGAIAIFTSANGFLLFLAAIPLLRFYNRKDQIYWAIAGVLLLVLYIIGYQQPSQRNGLLENLLLVKSLFLTGFTYLGAFSAVFFPESHPWKIVASTIVGIPVSILMILNIWKGFFGKEKNNVSFSFLLSIQLFVLLTAGLYSLSRANLPLSAVFESRYGINHAILLSSLLVQLILKINNKIAIVSLISFAILYFTSSYFFYSQQIYQFNRGNIASIVNQQANHRDFFYHFRNGEKLDLTAPTLHDPSQLQMPLVNFTSDVPSSGKYFNDVIQLTFEQKLYHLPKELSDYYQSIKSKKYSAILPSDEQMSWNLQSNMVYFKAPTLKVKVKNGTDGFYVVLQMPSIKPLLYALQFKEIDYRNQLYNPFSVCLRNAEIGIPFSILPNGKYVGEIVQIQNGKLYKLNTKFSFEVN